MAGVPSVSGGKLPEKPWLCKWKLQSLQLGSSFKGLWSLSNGWIFPIRDKSWFLGWLWLYIGFFEISISEPQLCITAQASSRWLLGEWATPQQNIWTILKGWCKRYSHKQVWGYSKTSPNRQVETYRWLIFSKKLQCQWQNIKGIVQPVLHYCWHRNWWNMQDWTKLPSGKNWC